MLHVFVFVLENECVAFAPPYSIETPRTESRGFFFFLKVELLGHLSKEVEHEPRPLSISLLSVPLGGMRGDVALKAIPKLPIPFLPQGHNLQRVRGRLQIGWAAGGSKSLPRVGREESRKQLVVSLF